MEIIKGSVTKRVCLFCFKEHKRRPALCDAKSKIMSIYFDAGLEPWRVFAGIRSGLIDLDGQAKMLLSNTQGKRK